VGINKQLRLKKSKDRGKKPQNIGEFMLGSQIKKGAVI
jgi:methionyl-tRNA formyltransferase